MNCPVKYKARIIAATVTLGVHLLLFTLLIVDFTRFSSTTYSPDSSDDLMLSMDLEIPENLMDYVAKDNLSKIDGLNTENNIRPEGNAKQPSGDFQQTVEEEKVQDIIKHDSIIVLEPAETKKKFNDSILFDKKDSLIIAELLSLKTSNPKTSSKDDVLANRARIDFYRKNTKSIVNFKKVYPYALKIKDITEKLNKDLSSISDEKQKKKLINETEKILFKEYEAAVRNMTMSQGRLLLKLVCRETGKTGYDIIKDYQGAIPATFWLGVGKLFGQNLKAEFRPEQEDSLIENIVKKYKSNDLY